MSVKIALGTIAFQALYNNDPMGIVDLAQRAEAAGVDTVVFTDHVVMGERLDRYPFGDFPMPLDFPWYEPMTMMTAVAAATKSIRVATGILISPLRPASLLVKQAATLDALSHGRLDLGVGVGWQPEEYEAQGLDFEQRWQLLDEQLQIARAMWAEAPVSINTQNLKIDKLWSLPLPDQAQLPIWFGVAPTARQAKRIAQFGQGWIPIKTTAEFIAEGKAVIGAAFIAAGKDPDSLMIRAHAPLALDEAGLPSLELAIAGAKDLIAAGATHIEFEVSPYVFDLSQLDDFLQKIVALKD